MATPFREEDEFVIDDFLAQEVFKAIQGLPTGFGKFKSDIDITPFIRGSAPAAGRIITPGGVKPPRSQPRPFINMTLNDLLSAAGLLKSL